jgi:hypothetical protein
MYDRAIMIFFKKILKIKKFLTSVGKGVVKTPFSLKLLNNSKKI